MTELYKKKVQRERFPTIKIFTYAHCDSPIVFLSKSIWRSKGTGYKMGEWRYQVSEDFSPFLSRFTRISFEMDNHD